jgi:hypothetical protein
VRSIGHYAEGEPRCNPHARRDIPIGFPSIIALWFAVWGGAQSLALYRAGTPPHDRNHTKEIRDLAAALTDDAPLVAQFTSAFTFYLAGIWLD